MRSFQRPVWLCAALLLAACGGGGMDNSGAGSPPPPPRGTLLQSPPALLSTVTAVDLLAELNIAANQQLLSLSGAPACDILMYDIKYETVGGANEPTTASAALLVPTGLGANCTGARPIVLYAHGTTTNRTFTMANLQNTETLSLAAMFASKGYIVVAPNYAGFDTSALDYHPYLIADQQSKDMIDALAAFVDAVFYGRVNGDAPVSSTLLLTAYQRAYGNIYSSAADVFTPQYADGIDSLLPTTTPRSQLYAEGKLPEFALFSATPPAAEFAADTPAITPANLAEVFALGFGTGNLLQNSYRLSYLEDAQSNPDGGWPTPTTGVAAAAPGLSWRQALKTNDLRNWVPTAPTLLCGGDMDPLVFWFNTALMQSYWAAHAAGSMPISVLDLDSAATAGDPYAGLKQDFVIAKNLVAAAAVAQGATDGGALAVAEVYHATLVAPFCFAAVKTFFAAP